MQRTNVTVMVARILTVGLVAGSFVLAAPARAQQGYRGSASLHGGDGWRGGHVREQDHAAYRGPWRGEDVRPHASFDRRADWGHGYQDRRFDHGYDRGYDHGGYGYR
jgi:hypothetical protein